jgi:uncharacterized protein YceK
MRRAPVPLMAFLAMVLSGCGSVATTNPASSPPASATAATAPSTPPASTAATTGSTSTSPAITSATTTASSAGPPPCTAGELALSFLGGQGAAGHGELGFALRNTSQQTCSTIGYPGIQFLDRSGGALPTIPTHTTTDYFGSVPKALLDIAPGASVSFRLGVTHGAAGPTGCTTAFGLQVIPPNDTATLRTTIPYGAYECQTATVSPLAPGSAAFSGP